MLNKRIDNSTILIVSNIDETLNKILSFYSKHEIRIIRNNEKDDFLLAQATQAIKEAYISSNETKYIFLCGKTFRNEAQNSLLKVLEEPPKNVVFIIITNSKSTILPTIFSRMPHIFVKDKKLIKEFDLDVTNLDLKDMYNFLKQNQRISKNDAKEFIESSLYKINSKKIKLSEKELEIFSKSIKLLELNSRPVNVLTTFLLTLLNRKHRV